MLLLILISSLLVRMSSSNQSVVIIGAGISGFAAGERFLRNGFTDFVILEASNRIGGRIHTIPFGENVIDLGAQWCEGVGNSVFNLSNGLLEESKFELSDVQFVDVNGNYYPWIRTSKLVNYLNEVAEEVEDGDGSLGNYIDEKFVEKFGETEADAGVKNWFFKSRLEEEGAESLYDISLKLFKEFQTYPGSQFLTWKNKGYETIFNVLDNGVKDKVLFGKEVVNIQWDGDEVLISCADGDVFKSRKVLITVSLGVLKEKLQTLFTPNLPKRKLEAIENWGFGNVDKIFLEFDTNWWEPSDPNGFNFIWNQTDDWLNGIFCLRPIDYQKNILLAWIVTSDAAKMENLSDTVVKNKVMEMLRMFLHKKYEIPDPVNFIRSKWKRNPFFRGAYSYPSVSAEKLGLTSEDLRERVKSSDGVERLFFAGEATSKHSWATVHGALDSGWNEAEHILKSELASTNNGIHWGDVSLSVFTIIVMLYIFLWL